MWGGEPACSRGNVNVLKCYAPAGGVGTGLGKLALAEEVGVGPGTTTVSQAVGTSLPLSSQEVVDEVSDESHREGTGSPECEGTSLFRELITRVREFLELPRPSSHPSTLQTGSSAPLGLRGKVPLPWCCLVIPWL